MVMSAGALLLLVGLAPPIWAQGVALNTPARANAQNHGAVRLLERPARLQVENALVAEALLELQQTSGVRLAFSPSMLPELERVSCDCETLSVRDALETILAGTSLRFEQNGRHVVILPGGPGAQASPAAPEPLDLPVAGPIAAAALVPGAGLQELRTGTIAGRVSDAVTGEPLPGVQISLEGTSIGTLTNREGRYVLVNIEPGRYVVRAQYIGYSSETREVEVQTGQSVQLDFALRTAAIELEGVVVTGTAGQARRREVGNTITQINARELENMPIRDVGDVLQARVAGGLVMDNSGQVGAGRRIRLRGFNSISQSNHPIIYVDGVRISSDPYTASPGVSQASSPLSLINPADIERVEVVKGAAASTLYGTEANAGVIQIFTRRGSRGEPRWSLGIRQGINNLGHVGPKEDPTGLFLNDCTDFPGCPASGTWLRNGHTQGYDLSVQGGGETLTYYLSGRFEHEEGVIDPQYQQGWALRGNFGFDAGPGLNIRFTNSYSHQTVRWLPDGNNAEAFLINVIRGPRSNSPDYNHRPILEAEHFSFVNQMTSGVNVTWTPTSSMSHRLNMGVDLADSEATRERPWGYVFLKTGDRTTNNRHRRTLTMDYAGTWNTQIGSNWTSSLSWGGQLYDRFTKTVNATGEDFSGPGAKVISSGARTSASETRLRVVSGGVFLQEMIGWKDRLFVTGGVRWDGFSTFGEGAGVVAYPKISAAYTISDHDFWPEWAGAMKLRAAVGESGMAPGAFDAVRVWQSIAGDDGQPGVRPGNPGNPDLGPERTREFEFGFEGTVLDDRVSFEFTHYTKRTYDALIPVEQTPSMGFVGTQLENVGELESWGNELFVNVVPVRRPDLHWEFGVRLATNETRAVDLGGLQRIAAFDPLWQQWIIPGLPVPAYYGPVVQNPNEVGVPPVYEEEYLGPVYPTLTASLSTSATLSQRLTLSALGEFQGGHYLTSGVARQQVRRDLWPTCIGLSERIEAGDIAGITARDQARCSYTNSYLDWTERADFFKLRQISLSYRLPESWLPDDARSVTVRLEASNLFTITGFPGIDPEAIEDGSLEGNAAFYRVEYYNIPPPRRFQVRVNVDF